ncbi:hypothetical protein DL96DRAFT_1244798 [Flagelloscypha sp. PMI_526]|nr:hypothetical protein DL96DRAFT_1244798 [Flagelloscypha sp. PMI_526]
MPSVLSLSVAAVLAALPAANAWEHYITVGKGGNKYDPPFIHASKGDKVHFQFFPKNHTVTQSPFETPCTAQQYGINSGFQPVADDYNTKWFEFEVKEDDKPLWFYCQQAKHCSQDGMVFAINPPAYGDKTFDAFQKLAKQQNQDAPPAAPPQQDDKWWEKQPDYSPPKQDDKSGNYQSDYNNDYKNDGGYQQPTEHYITVGKGGNKFDPPSITANLGDVVKFQFFPKNHTVTQSPFNTPCTAQSWGIDSGFKPVSDEWNTQWFEFEVKETTPLWFYCQQAKHCSSDGMVFAVNAPTSGDKTFDAFQKLAKTQNQDAPASSGSGSGSGYGNSYGASGSASISGALEADTSSSSDSGFSKWAPVVIGLLAANLFVGLVLVIMSVLGYIRRGGRDSSGSRSIPVAYAPVREKDSDAFLHSGEGSYRDDNRPYSEQ